MDLEGIMLSEISQRKLNTVWYHLYVEVKKIRLTGEYNKERLTDAGNKLVITNGERERRRSKTEAED